MRTVLGAVFALILFAAGSRGQTAAVPSDADRAAIRDVISRQLEAFQRDDATAAFGFAAPSIQAMFGDPDHFMDMVRRGYQPVYRPHSVQFGELDIVHGEVVQQVDLIGPDGVPALALYKMEHEADGGWRIAGCVLAVKAGESV
jgi:hypothetical protein